MNDWIDAAVDRSSGFVSETFSGSNQVKSVQPSNAAIIAGLAVACWLPVALSAYLLAG